MWRTLLLSICFIFGISTTGWTEFYQYKDASGVIRFTDNLALIPLDQRDSAKQYKEEKSPEAITGEPAGNVASPLIQPLPDPAVEERLKSKKADLEAEYERLQREVESLQREKDSIPAHAYNDSAMALNQKITEYEKRRAAFEKEIEAYQHPTPAP